MRHSESQAGAAWVASALEKRVSAELSSLNSCVQGSLDIPGALRCVQEFKYMTQGILKQHLGVRADAQVCLTDTKHLCLDRTEL